MGRRRFFLLFSALIFAAASPAAAGEGITGKVDRLILKRSYGAATALLLKQAEAGQVEAQYRLGMMLRLGRGGDVDEKRARLWLTRAAGGGSQKAAVLLERMNAAASVRRTALATPPWKPSARPNGPVVDAAQTDRHQRSWVTRAAARGKADLIGLADHAVLRPAALLAAAEARDVKSAATLLAAGDEVSERDANGRTALVLAARSPELLQMMIAAGADLSARDGKGRDALASAARSCSTESADLLIRAGAYPSFDLGQLTPLHHAALHCADTLLIQRLAGVQDADAPDRHGRTALWYAAAGGKAAFIPLLVSAGAAANFPDSDGLTPLHAAARAGEAEAVAALLKSGATAQAQTRSGDTALMLSAASGCSACAAALLDAGVLSDAANQNGDTALILAVKAGWTDAVRLLLRSGADADHRNNARETARAIAARTGSPEMQMLFEPV